MKKKLFWLILLIPFLSFAQLSITTNTSPATCAGNGSVDITIDGTQTGYNYNIVLTRIGGSPTDAADNRDTSSTASGTSLSQSFDTMNAGDWNINVY